MKIMRRVFVTLTAVCWLSIALSGNAIAQFEDDTLDPLPLWDWANIKRHAINVVKWEAWENRTEDEQQHILSGDAILGPFSKYPIAIKPRSFAEEVFVLAWSEVEGISYSMVGETDIVDSNEFVRREALLLIRYLDTSSKRHWTLLVMRGDRLGLRSAGIGALHDFTHIPSNAEIYGALMPSNADSSDYNIELDLHTAVHFFDLQYRSADTIVPVEASVRQKTWRWLTGWEPTIFFSNEK
jgi:hypothetical protein